MSAALQCLLRAPAITSFYLHEFDLNLLDVDHVYETIAAEFMNIFATSVHEKKNSSRPVKCTVRRVLFRDLKNEKI